MESLIFLVIGLALVGFILWAIFRFVPMPELWRNLILFVVVIAVLLWLVSHFGLLRLG